MLTVGSLFSGIGGFDLGLERTGGFKTIWQCEIDPFCNQILEKHWPTVTRYNDIRTMCNIPHVDVICASPPCQPVSCAGKQKGAKDDRWMWGETYRIICEVRPEWVIVENVLGLLSAKDTEGKPGGLFTGILRDFSKSGYDVEWNVVSAASVGAPHLRKRVFIIAHSNQFDGHDGRYGTSEVCRERKQEAIISGSKDDVAHSLRLDHQRQGEAGNGGGAEKGFAGSECSCLTVSYTECKLRGHGHDGAAQLATKCCGRWSPESGLGRAFDGISAKLDPPWKPGWEDGVLRTTTDKTYRTQRLKALGNAIVPQCSELIGHYLLSLHGTP